MPCYKPLTGYWSKYLTENGKRTIVFNARDALNTDFKIQVPCGRCVGCRLEYARVWALRCWHESLLYDKNCFINLTYDDDHLPDWRSLVPEHFTNFVKRFRESVRLYCIKNKIPPIKIRYFGCGEYGDKSMRPHYHLIIFNYDFPDKKYHGMSKSGELTFISEELQRLWPYGFSLIGSVTFQSCSYVARYVMKKLKGDQGQFYLDHNLFPPFLRMSRKPGIGAEWFEKNRSQVESHLYVRSSEGQKSPLPRFYEDRLSDTAKIKLDRQKYENILAKKSDINYDFYSPNEVLLNDNRAVVLETIKKSQITSLIRDL